MRLMEYGVMEYGVNGVWGLMEYGVNGVWG